MAIPNEKEPEKAQGSVPQKGSGDDFDVFDDGKVSASEKVGQKVSSSEKSKHKKPTQKPSSKKGVNKSLPKKGKKTEDKAPPKKSFKKIIQEQLDLIGKNKRFDGVRKEKVAFGIFLSMPSKIRGTQKDFAELWKISENSLSLWKNDEAVKEVRSALIKAFLYDKTPDVLEALYNNAVTVNPWTGHTDIGSIKLWLQFVEEWKEGQTLGLTDKDGQVVFQFSVGKSPFIQPEDDKKKPDKK